MFCDYHVHTEYSDDSIYKMKNVVKDAISLGLKEICFTDHVDYGIKRDWDDPRGIHYRKDESGEPLANVDYEKYYIEYLQLVADGKGIEFNTSWHRYGLQDTTPSREILKLYKELGFTHFCTYDKMKPIFHRLEEI